MAIVAMAAAQLPVMQMAGRVAVMPRPRLTPSRNSAEILAWNEAVDKRKAEKRAARKGGVA
jgi:hypothetical protein